MSILLIHKQKGTLHLLIFSSTSLLKYLKFLSYKFSTCLIRANARYFILLETVLKGIVYLISFSIHLLFIYRKDTDFCELILHSASSLKVSISCRSFLVGILGLFVDTIITSANKNTLMSSRSNLYPLDLQLFYYSR